MFFFSSFVSSWLDSPLSAILLSQSTEKLSQNLSGMKVMIYGDGEHEAKQENIDALVSEIFKTDILLQLLLNIRRFEFEVC